MILGMDVMMNNLVGPVVPECISCTKCLRRRDCLKVIPGVGNKDARLMIIGDMPEQLDDSLNEPFRGIEGAYLRRMLIDAKIALRDVYLTTLLKCYSHQPVERGHIDACKNWLWLEMKRIQPKVIVPLGLRVSSLLLQGTETSMESMTKKWYYVQYTSAIIAPWYDIAYVLNQCKETQSQFLDFFKKVKPCL